jgi:hypothetical protein
VTDLTDSANQRPFVLTAAAGAGRGQLGVRQALLPASGLPSTLPSQTRTSRPERGAGGTPPICRSPDELRYTELGKGFRKAAM